VKTASIACICAMVGVCPTNTSFANAAMQNAATCNWAETGSDLFAMLSSHGQKAGLVHVSCKPAMMFGQDATYLHVARDGHGFC
jgi:hypothetical protein